MEIKQNIERQRDKIREIENKLRNINKLKRQKYRKIEKRQKNVEKQRKTDKKIEKGQKRRRKSVLEALGSPWDVQKEVPGATSSIDGEPRRLNCPPHPPQSITDGHKKASKMLRS